MIDRAQHNRWAGVYVAYFGFWALGYAAQGPAPADTFLACIGVVAVWLGHRTQK